MGCPIHVVTGFLGSGKTTFIRRLLADTRQDDTAVLINELGAVGIDDLLVRPVADNTYLLANGCICCVVLPDLKKTLLDMLQQRTEGKVPPFRRIVLETTGLASPASVLNTLHHDTHLKEKLSVCGLTAVVDADPALASVPRRPEWQVQIAAADRILLSKTDLADAQTISTLAAAVSAVNPDTAVGTTADFGDIGDFFAESVIRRHRRRPPVYLPTGRHNLHGDTGSCVLEWEGETDWAVLGLWLNMLLQSHGNSVMRLKGILHLQDFDHPVLIQAVQHCLYPPEHLPPLPAGSTKISRLVIIACGIDLHRVERSFFLFKDKLSAV